MEKSTRIQTALEWLGSLLIVFGVAFMIAGYNGNLVLYVAGIAVLTFGVRLSIDCAKRSRARRGESRSAHE